MRNNSIHFDPIAEMGRYLEDSSVAITQSPRAVIIAGGVATGKTGLRRAEYSTGYVLLDASDIFLSLCQGEDLDFPGPIEEPMNLIGYGIAQRICRERRHIVTEIIGGEIALLTQLLETIKSAGYQTNLVGVRCDTAAAVERNANRARTTSLHTTQKPTTHGGYWRR